MVVVVLSHFHHAQARGVQRLLKQPATVAQLILQALALECHLDGGVQLALGEGLEQVAVGLCPAGPLQGRVFGIRGQVDDRDGVCLPQLCGDVDAVHVALDMDVHQHQVGPGLRHQIETLLARDRNGRHVVPEHRQTLLQIEGDDAFIFHHENAGGLVHGGPPGGM